MQLYIGKDYTDMSRKAAADLLRIMAEKESPLLCTASGDTPVGLYNELANEKRRGLNTDNWYFVGLDEWVGKNENDTGSCRDHLKHSLYGPLSVTKERIAFFDGRAADLQKECDRVLAYITQHGPVQAAVVGLGLNGHVGFNEPGTSSSLRAHVKTVDPLTAQTGQKYFKEKQTLTAGITLGLAVLMETAHVLLLANGARKAAIVQKFLEDEISEVVPASLLRRHPGFRVYLDEEAAALLSNNGRRL